MNEAASNVGDAVAESMGLPFRYLDVAQVASATGLGSRSNLWAKVKAGEFPEPDRLNARVVRWRSDVVAKWLCDQSARADAERVERTQRGRQRAQRKVDARAREAA